MNNRTLILLISVFSFLVGCAPSVKTNTPSGSIDELINATEVKRIEETLSSDDMQGRATMSRGIDKAADFIAQEFKKAGIQPLKGSSYFQEFNMLERVQTSVNAEADGVKIEPGSIFVFTAKPELKADQASGFEKIIVGGTDRLPAVFIRLQKSDKNYLILADTSHATDLERIKMYTRQSLSSESNIIIILTNKNPSSWSVAYDQQVNKMPLKNVVGMIPGKSRKDEYVIFSGHYDHLGIKHDHQNGEDSIYNGANDDAAGSTAVMILAKYFAAQNNNERTLIFSTFTAEEIGGFGSQYFSSQFDPSKVMAMFNIEMIGTDSKWGNNSAYITGYEKTDMGKILEKNLEGSVFKFYPDPYPDQQLFYRSDNATLARFGVPAHTISTSKMDSEKYYHTIDDEINTLDMKNMAEIIKAIAISSRSIVAGTDTPSRVDVSGLK
jgi:hypothetical protein